MNTKPKALLNFMSFSDANLELKAGTIINAMTGNDNFPTPTPPIASLSTASSHFTNALNVAKTGSREDAAIKNEKRADLEQMLRDLAAYVNFTANGNRAMLLSSGFDITRTDPPLPITKPEGVTLLNGANPGELVMDLPSVDGARAYVFEVSADAALADTSWKHFMATASSYTFTGLQPGKQYFCRVAVVGSKSQMIYSDVVSRFVI